MAVYKYPKFKIRTQHLSGQGLMPGDIVRRQYTDSSTTIYSLMVVLEHGIDSIFTPEGVAQNAPYFIGALLEGDEPQNGQLLDFVRVTNLFDTCRSGAMYITSSDDEAPYMDVIDATAQERSLCYPESIGAYHILGEEHLSGSFSTEEAGIRRIFRLSRNNVAATEGAVYGLSCMLNAGVAYPQRIIVSCKLRASRPLAGVSLRLGYNAGDKIDGEEIVTIGENWHYHVMVVTAEYPEKYPRSISFDLSQLQYGDWCEVAELNIVRHADLAQLTGATKVRIGKVTGIVDPLFGVLNGYGAYFQSLYATRNVNIAGTLTAGDENGFAGTFYVGRIHKNRLKNSLNCDFITPVLRTQDLPPTGIGNVVLLPAAESILLCQDKEFTDANKGQRYCFSFWARTEEPQQLLLAYNSEDIGNCTIGTIWQRYNVCFNIQEHGDNPMTITFRAEAATLFCAPQLEMGTAPSLYQATDATLNPTDEYGAWFSRGGIGGTIQNPLLRLEADGSIRSRDDGFVIQPDGTGHFAGGRFRWTRNTIELQDVTIRWDALDEKTQESITPKSVAITGTDTFHYADDLSDISEPRQITLIATEQNFTASSRRWEYQAQDGTWHDAGSRTASFQLQPTFHGWESRSVLTLRYTAEYDARCYVATHTVTKQSDGQSAYSVYVETSHGTVLHNGNGQTTLRAYVLRGGEEITNSLPEECFRWIRRSELNEEDELWNTQDHRGKMLVISGEDVFRRAVFNCEVTIQTQS